MYVSVKVPAAVAKTVSPRELADYAKELHAERIYPFQRAIDPQPADGGSYKTLQDWIPFFNAQGKAMISAPDVYRVGKAGSPELIASLRRDLNERWMVSSTRILYYKNTLDAKIVHNFGSAIAKPTQREIIVPAYQHTPLQEILATEEGLAYNRALFGTNDSAGDIAKTLFRLIGRRVKEMYEWTPNQEDRAASPERVVGFSSGEGGFLVYGDWVVGDNGRSRGVSVKSPSAKPTRKNGA